MSQFILCLSAIILFSSVCQGTNGTIAWSSLARFGTSNTYYVYTRDNPRDPLQVYATAASATATRILRTKTVIIVHGEGGSYLTSLNPTVKDALLTAEDVSVIVVDWRQDALVSEFAVVAVPEVGTNLANLIRFMVNARRITLDNLHLVGFGLGAHVVAYAARALTTGRVARITGLDPTENVAQSMRLRYDDAHYVEVIHTNAGNIGISDAIGVVDFFPNGGINQEGCSIIDNNCHHNRAWKLFAATLTHNNLVGNQCESQPPSEANCKGFTLAMGNNDLNKYGIGTYFFETSDTYPFKLEPTTE